MLPRANPSTLDWVSGVKIAFSENDHHDTKAVSCLTRLSVSAVLFTSGLAAACNSFAQASSLLLLP